MIQEKNQIISDAYYVQTVGNDVFALAYTNNTNTIYKITDNCKAESQFHTDKMPEKAIINKYGCFYTIGNSLDFIEMNSNNDISFDKIEGADDFTVTDNGVYWLKFTGNIDDGSEPFSDLNNLSISEELWYYSFDGNSNLIAELNDGYGSFLTRCYDNVVYRYNTGLYMADQDGSECIVENVMPTSIVVYDQMIYFSDLANGSLNRYSIKDGTLTKINDYIEIVGINNNNLIDSSFNDIVLNQ